MGEYDPENHFSTNNDAAAEAEEDTYTASKHEWEEDTNDNPDDESRSAKRARIDDPDY